MSYKRRKPIHAASLLYTQGSETGDEAEHHLTRFEPGSVINGRGVVLEECSLNRTRILQAPAFRVQRTDLEVVDAANANLGESGWRDTRIHESRFTGAQLNFTHMIRTEFDACQMNHVQLQECTLKEVRFDNCDLRGAYFNGSQMQGTVFEGSNLAGADFARAVIAECDFRRTNIEDIRISPDQLRGVIVTADQALYLARLFGLDVRE